MASSPSYVPGVSHETIVEEETWLQGTLLSNFFFGIQTTLGVMAFLAVLRKRNPNTNRMRTILLVYIAALFAIGTAIQGLLIDWIQMAFITQRNYPGGPSAFLVGEWAIPVNLASNIMVVCANWMMDSLLVWRCHVVCNSGEGLWWLGVAIPLTLMITVFVTGSIFIYQNLHTMPSTTYILAYALSSLALNLTATGFIVARLLVHRHRLVSRLGGGHGQAYISIVAVVIESAAIYAVFLLCVMVAFALGSPLSNTLQQVVEQVQTIASFLIILRIARGEGWMRATITDPLSASGSLNVRVRQRTEENAIQLEALSTQPDEEWSVERQDGVKKGSFPDLGLQGRRDWAEIRTDGSGGTTE